jgi:MGT family glycosyltransferase
MVTLQEERGLDAVPEAENSPRLSIFFTSRRFLGANDGFPPNYYFVGPAIGRPEDTTEFPWSMLSPLPRVLVTLGSINPSRGGRFYDAVGRALGSLPIQVIVVSPERFGPFPDNFIVRGWIPQLKVMECVDAIISHGGPNTVNEALWYGLPQVVAPIKDDQPYTAHCLVNAGAGVRISFPRPRPEAIREAVDRILEEPSFRRAAERLRASFPPVGGGQRAAELLEQMAAGDLRESSSEPTEAAPRESPSEESLT